METCYSKVKMVRSLSQNSVFQGNLTSLTFQDYSDKAHCGTVHDH